VLSGLKKCSEKERTARIRNLCRSDLYFLLRYGCNRIDLENQWCFDRCREVQAEPDGFLDLWAREHYKSTIITFGLTILNILNDPEITVGIFSHTRPIAKGFLRQIKREFEANEVLKHWFPDILWANPRKEAPKWSEDDGIVVRRQGNPKESTVEAWGLVDGQPTAKHYKVRNYDDIVVPESVTTPDMIAKTTRQWQLSDNLGTVGGAFRVAGTRYHFNDSYGEMIRSKVVKVRLYACTKDGTENFTAENCRLMPPEVLTDKRRAQGPYTFATQMLLDPKGDDTQGFKREWLRFVKGEPKRFGLNVYIIVDPANSKRKGSDYTAMWVVGLGADRNYVVLDVIRDRLNLRERVETLFDLVDKYKPLAVGYEEYGLQADIQHVEHLQEERNYRFRMVPLKGATSKRDRIARLLPLFEEGRIFLPQTRFRTMHDGDTVNLIDVFIEEEYMAFPVPHHDDMLDALARIADPDWPLRWPQTEGDHQALASFLPRDSVNPNRSRYSRSRRGSHSYGSQSGGGEQG
jgi:predicted phage terminase large subunit-like protein